MLVQLGENALCCNSCGIQLCEEFRSYLMNHFGYCYLERRNVNVETGCNINANHWRCAHAYDVYFKTPPHIKVKGKWRPQRRPLAGILR